jgi:hypothetical protein
MPPPSLIGSGAEMVKVNQPMPGRLMATLCASVILSTGVMAGPASAGLQAPVFSGTAKVRSVAVPALPCAAAADDHAEQMLAILDTQIQSAAMLAHFIWSTSKFANFAEGFAAIVPDRAKAVHGAAARFRTDVEVYLDVYSNLLLQISSGPARLNVATRVDTVENDMSQQGLVQFKRFLPVLIEHIRQLESGTPPSRDQMRASILSVPSALGQQRG